ncbi:hypothetical protein DL95DRAFT_378477 [Leptodontidium sp. 2 PMI_412]|nr:hypothetical protein DL95DRAFT_378477 [Leptodontidium sp. 2 PMI_412]
MLHIRTLLDSTGGLGQSLEGFHLELETSLVERVHKVHEIHFHMPRTRFLPLSLCLVFGFVCCSERGSSRVGGS